MAQKERTHTLKILFLSPRQCWPTRSGAKLREYHFLHALSRDADVDYAYFVDPGSSPLSQVELPLCREVVPVPKPGAYTIGQKLAGLVGKWPLPILNYTSPMMMDAVGKLLSKNRYDLIHLDSIHMIRYAEGAGTPVVYNWHNIESEAMKRFARTVGSGPKSWYARVTADKMEALERQMLRDDFGHIVCSERERIELSRISPGARVSVVENGVDTAHFQTGHGTSRAKNIVFVGTMDYYPNVEAAISFVANIWPSIRNMVPGIQLAIVGANPTQAVRDLGQTPGITVTGTVLDVRPYYQNALAALVPLRTGGGTRLKILEAMAAGVPVVSTPLGAEGLAVTPDTDILMANPDDVAAWTNHLVRLANESTLVDSLASAGLELVKSRYDWQILGRKLTQTYATWLGRTQ